MLTSIGVPSHDGAVLRGALLPHSRTPLPATLQLIPRAFGMAACAMGATSSDPAMTDSSTSFRMNLSSSLSPRRPSRAARLPDARRILTVVRLAGGELLRDLVRAATPLNACGQLGMPVAELGCEALPAGSHRDLVAILADCPDNRLRDLSRCRRAEAGRRLHRGVGEHAGLADEAGRDDRDAHPVRM